MPNDKILGLSKFKALAADNLEFDENGRKFSIQVENPVGKVEIARCEQLLFFPQCFQKACIADMNKSGLVWKRVNSCQTTKF